MAATERITMTMRELDRFKVIEDVADGKLKPWRAEQRLELTSRQIRRLVERLREHGAQGLVSRRRSKPGNNRLNAVTAERARSIIRERHAGLTMTDRQRTESVCRLPVRSFRTTSFTASSASSIDESGMRRMGSNRYRVRTNNMRVRAKD